MRPFTLDPPKNKWLYKDGEEIHYADIYPQRPGQPEDELNEKSAREGYTFTSQIKNETPAAFDVIQETLGSSLSKLAYMGKQVISEQLAVPIPNISSYQIPEKLFMKEPNRENWAIELASPEISLFNVAQQKVPIYRFVGNDSSLKDAKLIELCMEREIPFQRALWFIKCIGYNDLRPQKSNPTLEQHHALSREWTKVISSYFLQLLNELSSENSGGRRSQALPDNGDQWSAKLRKLQYFISFCRLQYDENILNKSDFLREFLKIFKAVTDRMNCLNQIAVLTSTASLFLDQFKHSRYFMIQLVQCSLQQFIKLKASFSAFPALASPILQIQTLLQQVALTAPSTYVSLNIWRTVFSVAKDIFSFENSSVTVFKQQVHLSLKIHQKLSEVEVDIRSRVERLFPVAKQRETSKDLNALLCTLEADCNALKSTDKIDFRNTNNEFLQLLNWAIEGSFFKTARPFIASKFLQEYCDTGKLRQFLFEYLDGVMLIIDVSRSERICYFLNALQEVNLFSISYFLQYSIARKDLDKDDSESNAYLSFLSAFPVRNPERSFIEMRSLWLTRKMKEEQILIGKCKTWICERLPGLFGTDNQVLLNLQQPVGNSFESYHLDDGDTIFADLASAPGFVRFSISQWLKDSVLRYVVYPQAIGLNNWKTFLNAGASLLNPRQFQFIIVAFESLMDHLTLFEVCIWLLQKSSERAIQRLALLILVKYRQIYSYSEKSQLICKTIYARFASPKPKNSTPLVYHSLLSFASCCGETYDLDIIKQSYHPAPVKKSADFMYLKDLKDDASSIATISQRIAADCTNADNAAKILHQVIQILQIHYLKDSAADFSKRKEMFLYIFARLHECGTFMEDAIHGFLLSNFVNQFQSSSELSYQPWMMNFIHELIVNRSYCAQKFIDYIVMPLLVILKSEPQKISILGNIFTDFISILDLIINIQFHTGVKETIAVPSIIFTSFSRKDGAIAIFHTASILHFLSVHMKKSSHPALDRIENFLGKLVKSENWFKDYFRSEHRNFEGAILFDDPLTAKSSCAIFCNLLHPNRDFAFPNSAETCITTFSLMLDSELSPDKEIISKLILRYAISQAKAGTPGWENVLTSLFSNMTEGLHISDISPFTTQFSEEFRIIFLDYFSKIQDVLIECNFALTDPEKCLPIVPLLDDNLWPNLLKRIRLWVTSVISIASSKDEKKDMKTQIIDFLNPLIQSVINLQEKQSNYEDLPVEPKAAVGNSMPFGDYCKLLLQVMMKYLLDFQDELQTIPLLQSLFLMLSSRLLEGKDLSGMRNSIFDVTAILSEDLSKTKTKEMTSWIADNTPLLLRNEKVKDQIMTLLPFAETNSWFHGLYVNHSNAVTTVESQFLKPWEIVSRGKAGPEIDSAAWKLPITLEKINDTPFSLAHFNAKIVRPTQYTFESLCNHGWRPLSSPSIDMRLDEDILDISSELLYKMTAKIDSVKSEAKKDLSKSIITKTKRQSGDQQNDKKRQKKSL